MANWRSSLDLSRPFWDDYRASIRKLDGAAFPPAQELNKLLPAELCSGDGCPIKFVPASDLPGIQYEHHIYTTGEVSTRENSWHDLFNALVWSRFPRLKVAMNARHFEERQLASGPARGKVRDALTLLDESGAIVVSSNKHSLEALASHDWSRVFQTGAFPPDAASGQAGMQVFVCGHALLEKFLQPYKAVTAQVLLVQADEGFAAQPRESILMKLDQALARALMDERVLHAPASLSPLPLMGIPGWWPGGVQDDEFYSDQTVFRSQQPGRPNARVLNL